MRKLKQTLLAIAIGLMLIWCVSIYALAHHDVIYTLALVPRNTDGLIGILTMPLVHGSLTHLSVNTSLYIVMAALVLARSLSYYVYATLLILVMSGGALWAIGRDGAHIGASALIFGYFGLLATRGLFERRFWPMLSSLVIATLYAGLLGGIVPGDSGVSWEGHLTGLLAGIASARLLTPNNTNKTVNGEG